MNKFKINIVVSMLLFLLLLSSTSQSVLAASEESLTLGKSSTSKTDAFANSKTMKLNHRHCNLVKGKSIKLKVVNLSSNFNVVFTSNNSKIASVSSNGKVTGKKNGTATITATVKSGNRTVRKLTTSVEVGPAAVSVVIPKSSMTMTVNQKKYLKVSIKPSNTVENATFKSSNPKVATINKDGQIKALSTGETIITATIGNKKYDSCKIKVTKRK